MITQQLNSAIELIRHPERMDRSTIPVIQAALEQYPYYQTLHLLLLQNMYKVHDPAFSQQLKKSAVMVADRSVLFDMVEGVNYNIPVTKLEDDEVASFGGDKMLQLIDNFLKGVPEQPRSQSATGDTSMPDPMSDYASYLEQLPDIEEETVSTTSHRQTNSMATVSAVVEPIESEAKTVESKTEPVLQNPGSVEPVTEQKEPLELERTAIEAIAPTIESTEEIPGETSLVTKEAQPETSVASSAEENAIVEAPANDAQEHNAESGTSANDMVSNPSEETSTPALQEDEFTVASIRKHLNESDDSEFVPLEEESNSELQNEAFYTETMAGIYIKQQKYEQALEIIRTISAQNPKKSVYFADQIRYLELLIRINKNKK